MFPPLLLKILRHCHVAILSTKLTRQLKYSNQLLDLGVDYRGPPAKAKSTLNRFLRHDAQILGIAEIGNGNNRNLMVRLFSISCLLLSIDVFWLVG
jgi:hypothetical protein